MWVGSNVKKVKKQPIILIFAGLALTAILFFFGRTTEPKKIMAAPKMTQNVQSFNIQSFIDSSKIRLTPEQALYVSKLENGISRGDVPAQQIKAFTSLANFWKDSLKSFEPYAQYIYEAAKLDNSEKNLTFAAQLFLDALRGEHDEAKLNWETITAIELFEKAIQLNPENQDLKIGLGSCYIFGTGRNGDPQQTMKGIQELLSVVKKDSSNMKAQFVLGVGGFVSGQYDKSIERFTKVIAAQPENLEAIAFLADTYAAKGDNENAVKWYTITKRIANNPEYSKEVDERIKMLK
jgi:tetratricopeptide (TPR) repeat protein